MSQDQRQPSFNPAIAGLDTPAIPLALSWLDHYGNQYGKPLDLSQAVPNYPPPPEVLHTLARYGGSTESTGYGNIEGEPLLRQRYAEHVNEIYRSQAHADHVHITSGCNQAFVATLIALCQPGDRVVMSNPCYFNHAATASMLGLKAGYIECRAEHHFLPTPAAIESALDAGTRVLALVSPNNPTGATYPDSLLSTAAQLCRERGVWLVLDETYRDFMDLEVPPHTLLQQPDWEQSFVQLYSFSKSLCIPGHRLGAVLAGPETVRNIAKVMDNLQICAPRAAQLTVAEHLPKLENWRKNNQREISMRASAFADVMRHHRHWEISSMGAYFAYVRFPGDLSAFDAAKLMAEEFGILCLPGSFFGHAQDRYLRMAFANVDSTALQALITRLADVSAHEQFDQLPVDA